MAKSMVLNSLKGLSAVVSGGSSGLGLATVHRLSKLGCSVAICDINEPSELPAENCYFVKADVTNENDVSNAMQIIEQRSKKLDILVNCAGVSFAHRIYNTHRDVPYPLASFDKIMKVNTIGTFNMIRNCCLLFNKNTANENGQRGVIINTAGIAAFDGCTGQVADAASAGAIVGMTLPLARDLARLGIRVYTIAPGHCATPLLLTSLPENVLWHYAKCVPFPSRFVHPDEYAHFVQFIIESPMMNGGVARLDGAIRQMP